MKKTGKQERPKQQAKKDLEPVELCRAMTGAAACSCGCSSASLEACAC